MELVWVACALGLCFMTYWTLRGGLVANGRFVTVAGFDMQSLGLGALAVVASVLWFGPLYGLALILTVAVHEFGHVAAYRIAGHSDARFRLIPLMGGVAISDQHPASQEKDFFISLMGPGICLAPMVTAYALSDVIYPYWDLGGQFLWVFASTTAALNFFNLLPFYPLDGSRCLRIICATYWRGGTQLITLAMSAAALAMAVWMQSFALMFFVVMGAQSIMHSEGLLSVQRPMGKSRGLLAVGAYLATAAAHLVGGWQLLVWFVHPV